VTNTPSEGPARSALDTFTPEQRTVMQSVVQEALRVQQREDQLRRNAPLRRAGRAMPYVVAGGALAATDPGQSALRATGDAAVYAGGQIASAAEAVGRQTVDAAQATGRAISDAAQATGQAISDAAQATGRAVADAAQATGHAISEGAQWVGDQAVSGAQAVGHAAVATGQAVSGFAVETWGRATEAAHAVGAWAAQYADQVASHPGNTAVTAALAAGAVVAATPQLRQAVANGVRAASRWAREAPSKVTEGLKNAYNKVIRSNPKTQENLQSAGVDSKGALTAVSEANAITGGQSQLPPTPDLQKALGQDGSQRPLTGVVIKSDERQGAQAGEAANPAAKGGDKFRGPDQSR